MQKWLPWAQSKLTRDSYAKNPSFSGVFKTTWNAQNDISLYLKSANFQ